MATSHTHLGAIHDDSVAFVCGHCAGDLESDGHCHDDGHRGGAGGRGQRQGECVVQHNGALAVGDIDIDGHFDGHGTLQR